MSTLTKLFFWLVEATIDYIVESTTLFSIDSTVLFGKKLIQRVKNS